MRESRTIHGNYFYGNKISDYGIEHGYVDYMTLAKAFDAVMNNDIINVSVGSWEMEHGFTDNTEAIEELEEQLEEIELTSDTLEEYGEIERQIEELKEAEEPKEVFQWFIISASGVDILEAYTDEIIYYNDELNIYLWGITHFGTGWDYVLTDIKIVE